MENCFKHVQEYTNVHQTTLPPKMKNDAHIKNITFLSKQYTVIAIRGFNKFYFQRRYKILWHTGDYKFSVLTFSALQIFARTRRGKK